MKRRFQHSLLFLPYSACFHLKPKYRKLVHNKWVEQPHNWNSSSRKIPLDYNHTTYIINWLFWNFYLYIEIT